MDLSPLIRRIQSGPLAFTGNDVDGDAGLQTWSAIARKLGVASTPGTVSSMLGNSLGHELVIIAESQLGVQEDSQHTNRGSAIAKYQAATSLEDQGWPWCAGFVDWCVWELFKQHPELAQRIKRPQTALAWGLVDWARAQNLAVFSALGSAADDPSPGDLVTYTFSHCGIVQKVDLDKHTFFAVEGNSNRNGERDGYEVVSHPRKFSDVGHFIRIS